MRTLETRRTASRSGDGAKVGSARQWMYRRPLVDAHGRANVTPSRLGREAARTLRGLAVGARGRRPLCHDAGFPACVYPGDDLVMLT